MPHPALLALFGGIVLSGLSPILVRLSPVDPGATAFWRLLMAAALMLCFARFSVRLPLRVVGAVGVAGFLLAGDLVLWNMAIVSTTVLEATLLVMLYPLLVAAIEIFWLKRPLGWPLVAGGLIAFAGAAIMTLGPTAGQSSLYGNALALIAAFFYAGSLLIIARYCRGHPIPAITFWQMLSAALFSLPTWAWEDHFIPRSAEDWRFMTIYGVVTFGGYLLINVGLTRIAASIAAILGYAQPVIATLIAYFLLAEMPSHVAMLGGAVVIAGLLLAGTVGRSPKPAASEA
ncbi:DMT family transporter [Dongia sp.]|uniref:DMT family transporter n=1 Tax=Dongia sp. TaxID=1977262 RepID=UPI0035B328F1